ncbi:MAG: hypothetical protein EOO11_18095 [Chitinophagaceae bacterium]|nr:MAG: hypothetical protein EOO11_18095 [Chitinophagaceae bacterium]
MKQPQTNFHEVIRRVLAHFNNHPRVWDNEPVIDSRLQVLVRVDAALEAAAREQTDSGSGAFWAKDDLLNEAATDCSLMATRLRSLARHSGDPLLAAAAGGGDSLFRYGAQADRIRHMRTLTSLAETHAAAAARFKLRPEDVAALNEKLARAEGYLNSGRDAQVDRSTATGRIPSLIDEGRNALEALDDDVPALLDEHPDFVDGYVIARRVYDRRGSRASRPAGE